MFFLINTYMYIYSITIHSYDTPIYLPFLNIGLCRFALSVLVMQGSDTIYTGNAPVKSSNNCNHGQ